MTRPRLYLVRHGEAAWNAEGRILTFTDQPLNGRGERQAATLAADLAGVRWDRAFSSPLVRARRTAEVVLGKRNAAPPLLVDERLREMDYGRYEGWSEAQFEADPVAATLRREGGPLPGVETEEAVAERARSFLASLGDDGGTMLVVGHGHMLRILLAVSLGLPLSFARSLRMRNCRPAALEPGPRPLLLALNGGDPSCEARPQGVPLLARHQRQARTSRRPRSRHQWAAAASRGRTSGDGRPGWTTDTSSAISCTCASRDLCRRPQTTGRRGFRSLRLRSRSSAG